MENKHAVNDQNLEQVNGGERTLPEIERKQPDFALQRWEMEIEEAEKARESAKMEAYSDIAPEAARMIGGLSH